VTSALPLPISPRSTDRFAIGALVGASEHLQLGVLGPEVGLIGEWVPIEPMVVQVSGDYSAQGATFSSQSGGPGSGSGAFQLNLWSLSVLGNVFGRAGFGSSGIEGYGGVGLGVAIAGLSTSAPALRGSSVAHSTALAFAAIGGACVRTGIGRVGLEVRYLLAEPRTIGTIARSLNLGGLSGQATYRFAF